MALFLAFTGAVTNSMQLIALFINIVPYWEAIASSACIVTLIAWQTSDASLLHDEPCWLQIKEGSMLWLIFSSIDDLVNVLWAFEYYSLENAQRSPQKFTKKNSSRFPKITQLSWTTSIKLPIQIRQQPFTVTMRLPRFGFQHSTGIIQEKGKYLVVTPVP